MSNEALTWAFALDLAMGPKFVLVVLADMADSEHSCYPGQELIAKRTGMAPRTVRTHLATLETDGWIARGHRFRADGVRTSDRYVLRVGCGVQMPLAADLAASGSSGLAAKNGRHQRRDSPGNPQEDNPQVETGTTDVVPARDSAQTLLAEWIDHCSTPPPSDVRGQVARHLKRLLDDGIPVEVIRAGLAEWHRKRLHPSALASVVHTTSLGPADRPSTADQRLASGVALVARLEERERRAELRAVQ